MDKHKRDMDLDFGIGLGSFSGCVRGAMWGSGSIRGILDIFGVVWYNKILWVKT